MSDAEDAARALDGFVTITSDDPRVQEFRDSVVATVASRPSPGRHEDRLSRVEAKLDAILELLRGGPPQ